MALCLAIVTCGPRGDNEARPAKRDVLPVAASLPATEPPLVDPGPDAIPPATQVGAHYYIWYPDKLHEGTLRSRLDPPQSPVLGTYSSGEPAVAAQHIAWASAFGIDFFTLDWWPSRADRNANIDKGFLSAPNIDDITFCLFYETWDLGFDERFEATPIDARTIERFVADLRVIGTAYFDHPSYLRVDGKPVLVLYLTRTLVGDVPAMIAAGRAALAELGHEVYFVADEVMPRVTGMRTAQLTRQPQPDRIALFDAVTAYNLYDAEARRQHGYGESSSFTRDAKSLYARYREASGGTVPVLPNVIPGYNDRGVRPTHDNAVISRRLSPTAEEGSFFRYHLAEAGLAEVDRRVPLLFITSWNEWSEDTAIEPVVAAPPTERDQSPSGRLHTLGHAYEGYGLTYLNVLRDVTVAVAGRVLRNDGAPAPGVVVVASQQGRPVARDVADRNGAYTLPRTNLGPGLAEVAWSGGKQIVMVLPSTTTVVDVVADP